MQDSATMERRSFTRAKEPEASGGEAAEVAKLLALAGIDHACSLWFQLLELATQQACDWAERSAACGAPLSPRSAAILGLRALSAEILSGAPGQADGARAAAEACLNVCIEQTNQAASLPARRRRWGEGALPQPPQRPGLLQRTVGCC